MSVSNLLLGVWLILVGVVWLGWIVIDIKILGLLGFITGIAVLFEGGYPAIFKRQ